MALISSHPPLTPYMAEKEEGAADWSNLTYDLLEEILNQLVKDTVDISDYARFAAVSVSWRQVYNTHKPLINPQLPVLMIPSNTPSSSNEDDSDQFCSFYKITDGKIGKVYDQLRIRMPSYRQFRGSGYGWLVTVDDDVDKGFPVRLFHPFLSYEISLPSLKHLPEEDDGNPLNCAYLHKAILSAELLSTPDKYIVMVIYGGERFKRLAYWTPGYHAWVPTGPKRIRNEGVDYKVEDVILSNNEHEFVAVTSKGTTFSFKVADILHENVADAKRYHVQTSFRGILPNKKLYLIPTSKRSKRKAYVLVVRFMGRGDEDETTKTRPFSTYKFIVYEPDFIYEREEGWSTSVWKKTDTLGGNTLFIGGNASMSICAANCPPICKPDCIYYTDDCYLDPTGNEHGAHDMGLFNLKDNSLEKHYPTDVNYPIWPIPIWVVFWVERIIRKSNVSVLRDQVV